jgi:hypothetical protein
VFGVGGVWQRLLGQASGYLGSESWCESSEARQYRVRDFWAWHRDFERFRKGLHAEFEHFEEWIRFEGLIEKEQFLGAYYERFDEGSGQDLVLS